MDNFNVDVDSEGWGSPMLCLREIEFHAFPGNLVIRKKLVCI